MDTDVDHYLVLGLLSGEDGAKLSEQDITKGYRAKAKELHPDKRPDDPTAHAGFIQLQTSYEVLKDEKSRKLFDDLLRVKREKLQRQLQCQGQRDSKRRKMMSDLEERERAADQSMKAREKEEMRSRKFKEEIASKRMEAQEEEERFSRKLKEEIARISAMRMKIMGAGGGSSGLDKDKVLKVSWKKTGVDYTALRLKEIFEKFGPVEDVVVKSTKKKGSALVVMVSKEAAVASLGTVLGDISNPLVILPLQPRSSPAGFIGEKIENEALKACNVVGAGFKAYQDSVLERIKKAIKKKSTSVHPFAEPNTGHENVEH